MSKTDLIIDDSQEPWTPNEGGQDAFMNDWTHRYCALAGGWYAGKTWAGARKLLEGHVMNAFDLNNQPTFTGSAVIGPTYQNTQDFDIPELKKAMNDMGLSWKFNAAQDKFWFVLPELGTRDQPSIIRVRSADKPDRITGWSAGLIWGDEPARWKTDPIDPLGDPFMQANGRLRAEKAKVRVLQFMLTFTHEGAATKIYEDFEDNPKPDHVLYRAGTFENPHAQEFGEAQRQVLSEDLIAQYLEGFAMDLRGASIYSAFKAEINKDPTLTINPDLALQLTMDFNIAPGMHAIIGQYDKDKDEFSALKEFHAARMTTQDMMKAFLVWCDSTEWQWPMLEIYGDATGGSAWAGTGKSCWDIVRNMLDKANIPYRLRYSASNPHVSDRVNAVNSAMRDANGDVHYRIHPSCKKLLDDYRKMKWDEHGEIDKSDRKLSHPSDAEGYRIWRQRPIRRFRPTPL